MSTQVLSPFPFFTDRDGKPLDLGYVYIGEVGQDPELFPQAVYWDEALTNPATQPLRTDGGYIVNGATPSAVYLDSTFSIRVRARLGNVPGTQVFYSPEVTGLGSSLRSVLDYANAAAADAAGGTFYVPGDISSSLANGAAVLSNYWGPGRMTTADGNKRGKWFSNIKSPPASEGNSNSIDTAFNGDLTHSIFQLEHRISGTTTLGQPATGYKFTEEASAFYGVMHNTSGWNQSTSGNTGRTAATFMRLDVKQYGQGDAMAYNASGFVTGAKAGATHFLANPAVALFGGDIAAGSGGVYLNPREIICHDNGYDVACVGDVINLDRTNDAGALSVFWSGYRVQSVGSKAVDNILSSVGLFAVGVDLAMTNLNFGANKAAISLKGNDRIYFNNSALASGSLSADCRTTAFNGDYLEYSSTIAGIHFVAGGTSVFEMKSTQVTVANVPLVVGAGLKIAAATPGTIAGQLALGTSTSTSATAGAAGAIPAQVLGYLIASLNGTSIKVPYYAV